jgi:hypothetical protein
MSFEKNAFICIYGIIGWGFLTYFVWVAFFFGGQEGYVVLAFNLFGEMIFELFIITSILLLMIFFSIHVLNEEKFAKNNK